MDNQEEEQELQEEEKGIDEGPHPKTPSPTSPKVPKKVDPPPPSQIHEKTNAERDALPYCDDKVSCEESEDERQELAKFLGLDQYGFMSPFKKTEKSESPDDSDVNQENAKQFESSDEESVESKSPVGPRYSPVTSAIKNGSTNSGRSRADSKFQTQTSRRLKWELSDEERVELKSPAMSGNSPVTSALKTGSTNSGKSLADSNTNEEKYKWELPDEEQVELKSPVVSGNAPVASVLKTESIDNCHESPADSSGNEASAAVNDSPQVKKRRTQRTSPDHKLN